MKILFAGGGTGGHITPIIAITREIKRVYPADQIKLFFIGPKDDFNQMFLSQEGIIVKTILAGKIRRYFDPISVIKNILDVLIKTPLGIIEAFSCVFSIAPDVIFSKGGYGSLPAIIAGWILEVPIFLQESDFTPGLANRFLSRFALEIFTSFPKTEYFPLSKIILVGNPTRREILTGSIEEAKELFGLSLEKPIIFIIGGSQGSQRINEMLLQVLSELVEKYEIIHQCGEKNFKQLSLEARIVLKPGQEKYYHLVPFLREQELKHAYAASDLIISRGGAASIFEIAALGKPSVLIPLPESAQNHQLKNAYNYAENGATLVMEESNLTPRFFLERINYLFSHPDEIETMAEKAKEFARPNAASIIADYLISYLSQ